MTFWLTFQKVEEYEGDQPHVELSFYNFLQHFFVVFMPSGKQVFSLLYYQSKIKFITNEKNRT